jgi:hypothetical protein
MKGMLPQSLILRMREEGRVQEDYGVFEIDISQGKVSWANNYVLDRSGYTLDQVQHMTLPDLIPEMFHEIVQDAVMDAESSKDGDSKGTTSIWPMKSLDGKVLWWAVSRTSKRYPMSWIHADHIQTTSTSGMSFVFMRAFMRAANGHMGLFEKVSELKDWTSTQIARLDEEDKKLGNSILNLEVKMEDALKASKEAALATKTTHAAVGGLLKSFQDFETKYGIEILKLIGTDSIHDKRMESFERHVKMTTDLAVKSIEMQAKASSEGFSRQAEETSKGLSKKVVIPVSIIATIVTIIQIAIERWVNK